jgi:hypothetical protein
LARRVANWTCEISGCRSDPAGAICIAADGSDRADLPMRRAVGALVASKKRSEARAAVRTVVR